MPTPSNAASAIPVGPDDTSVPIIPPITNHLVPPSYSYLMHHTRSSSAASYLSPRPFTQPPSPPQSKLTSSSSMPIPPLSTLPPPPYHDTQAYPLSNQALGQNIQETTSPSVLGLPSSSTIRTMLGTSRTVHINVHNYFIKPYLRSNSPLPFPSSLSSTSPSIWNQFIKFTRQFHLTFICLAWYAASALTNNAKKQILLQFPYPVSLTMGQFGAVAILCLLAHNRKWMALQTPSWHIVRTIFPLGIIQLGGHTCASMAMARVPVAFVHTVKSLSPLFTVIINRVLLGSRYPAKVWISLIPLIFGVILACTFGKASMAFHPTGFLFSVLSTVIFVLQSIISKRILTPQTHHTSSQHSLLPMGNAPVTKSIVPPLMNLDKINTMFYSSLMAWFAMVPMWLTSDFTSLIWNIQGILVDRRLVFLFILNGVSHFAQSLLAFSILTHVSTVTYSIVSLLKRIVVIVAAIAWFGDVVSGTQAVGVALTFVGLWMYQQAKGSGGRGDSNRTAKHTD